MAITTESALNVGAADIEKEQQSGPRTESPRGLGGGDRSYGRIPARSFRRDDLWIGDTIEDSSESAGGRACRDGGQGAEVAGRWRAEPERARKEESVEGAVEEMKTAKGAFAGALRVRRFGGSGYSAFQQQRKYRDK
jgi:hypothetical protein